MRILARIRRLRRRADFLAAASARRFHTERMTVQGRLRASGEIRDGAPAEGLHVGFTITKRVGHATERNRIRRRLRGVLAGIADELPDAPADVVLIARRPALAAPFETLAEDLRRALRTVTKAKQNSRGAKDTALPPSGAGDDAAPGALPRTQAHVPRPANPGRGKGAGRGTGKRADRRSGKGSDERSSRGPDTSTVHGTTDG